MTYPQFAEIEGKKYKINTSFRIAIECQEIATDETISDFERPLAIIYKLYGDEGLDNPQHYQKLLELGLKFLARGEEVKPSKEEPDMDFVQDMDYIEASFMSDYNIDISEQDMHWWKFLKLIEGLSNSDMGNCCVLNRIRNIRNYDPKEIKDPKERRKLEEAKQKVALKRKVKQINLDSKQKQNIDNFYEITGIKRKE